MAVSVTVGTHGGTPSPERPTARAVRQLAEGRYALVWPTRLARALQSLHYRTAAAGRGGRLLSHRPR